MNSSVTSTDIRLKDVKEDLMLATLRGKVQCAVSVFSRFNFEVKSRSSVLTCFSDAKTTHLST